MITNQEIHSLENRLRHYPSRTVNVFKTTHLNRILRKHSQETDADKDRKEFRYEQWIKSLFLMQIQKFDAVRPFVDQFKQNHQWQMICGFEGNVPTQGQYSRKIPDQRLQEVLVRTFQTYQQLHPLIHKKSPFNPSNIHLEILQQDYYPFRLDCSAIELSPARYPYTSWGYVATEKKVLPSARLHVVQDGIHENIVNYGPSGGHEHESPVADQLLNEVDEISAWLELNSFADKPRPLLILDRGYWRQARFRELDARGWGWSIPWKKRTLVGVQLEMLDFPTSKNNIIEMLVWGSKSNQPWRRIIGRLDPVKSELWDVLTNDWLLKPVTVLQVQKERWGIETLFQWIKQNTPIKRPLGTTWMSFVTHCLLVTLLHIILMFYLLLLGFTHPKTHLSRLLLDLRYSDREPFPTFYLIGERVA
jgi:hypothetical protein